MKALLLCLTVLLVLGCSGSREWTVTNIQDRSNGGFRGLRLEVVANGPIHWPLHLSVSAVDSQGKHVEAILPRWTTTQVAPDRAIMEFSQDSDRIIRPITFDLKVTSTGSPNLYVHHQLTANSLTSR